MLVFATLLGLAFARIERYLKRDVEVVLSAGRVRRAARDGSDFEEASWRAQRADFPRFSRRLIPSLGASRDGAGRGLRSGGLARGSGRACGRSPRASSAPSRRGRSGAQITFRSRSERAASPRMSAWLRSVISTSSSGEGPSPATKSPKTASSCSPTGWSRLVDARAAALHLARLLDRQARLLGDLVERRLAPELRPEQSLGLVHLLEALDDVDGHPDRPGLVRESARDGLADPPGRVGRELVAAAPVELLDGADQPERPFLDQVEERQALVAVVLRDRDDEAEVRLDHPLLRLGIAALDALRQLDLLRRRQERVAAGLAQEELERVGRRLVDDRLRRRRRLLPSPRRCRSRAARTRGGGPRPRARSARAPRRARRARMHESSRLAQPSR